MKSENLPAGILTQIGSFCSPADIVNLAIACPPISDVVLPGIYRCIIIDTVPRSLIQERSYKRTYVSSRKLEVVAAATVHTSAGIKRLLETLVLCPIYASKVCSFSACGNIALSDICLIPRVKQALRNSTGLKVFEWTACPESPPDIFSDFPKSADNINIDLISLAIDLAARSDTVYPEIYFPCLKQLRVRPFLHQASLSWLKQIVSQSCDLEDIESGRFLDNKSEIGSSFIFIGRSDTHQQQAVVPVVSIFFGGSVRREVHKLKSSRIDTSSTDCRTFSAAVDIKNLSELQLNGTGREDEVSHGLLAHITKQAPTLLKIEIDWDSSAKTMTDFLSSCCRDAQYMKLTVKSQPDSIIQVLSDVGRKLVHLESTFACDFRLSDLRSLESLTQLRVLKLPYDHTIESWKIAMTMKTLKLLELYTKQPTYVSNSTGGWLQHVTHSANTGLLMGGFHEQWDSHIRLSLRGRNLSSAVSANESSEYFTIDGRTIQLKCTAPSVDMYAW